MYDIEFNSIETERLVLRKFKESDAKAFHSYRTDPQVALYQGEGLSSMTLEQSEAFIRNQMDFEPGIPDSWFQIAIELKEEGKLIGDLAMHTLLDPKQVEIGFSLNPIYQNRGLAQEAVRHLLDYIFYVLDMHRVIAVTDVRNSGSNKLLERIGMRREGHFIKNAWYKGEYTDEYSFAVLKEEWQKR